jgi:hypothetical protein
VATEGVKVQPDNILHKTDPQGIQDSNEYSPPTPSGRGPPGIKSIYSGFGTTGRPVAPGEADGVAGQQPPHHGGKQSPAGLKQQVDTIEHQHPGKARGAGFIYDRSQTLDPVVTVLVIEKDLAGFDPPDNHVVHRAGGVYAGLTRHGEKNSKSSKN